MNKIANFIIKFRYIIFGVIIAAAVVNALLIPQVTINEDETKYLPDSSNMREGLDVMEKEFEDLDMSSDKVMRIMFSGLAEAEKDGIQEQLENMQYVDSVDYDSGEDYNKGDYTLFIINTEYDVASDEGTQLSNEISETYSEKYNIVFDNGISETDSVLMIVILIAVAILFAILLAMSGSWIEPFLFMIVIGIAVVLNMGTNIFRESVSDTTFSIAAILQLVLSIDYSIILSNRYRQERLKCPDKVQAMKAALSNSFSSIASSALTTVVGLLMLVFMSFKIGEDMGVVLAKGVALSLLCVFLLLPTFLLWFDRIIKKTSKKVLPIPTGGLAKFSSRFRVPLAIFFVCLFAGAFIMQNMTAISFSVNEEDQIAEVFPENNSIVLLYNNKDADKVQAIADGIEDDEKVSSVISYPTMFGKMFTSKELADEINDMSSDMDMDEEVLSMIYYKYYKGDELPKIKLNEQVKFIQSHVLGSETFGDQMDDSIKDNIDKMVKYTEKDTLAKSMQPSELAEFFEMEEGDISKLLILYYKDREAPEMPYLTIGQFVDFLLNDILNNPDYSSMIGEGAASQIGTLSTLTDYDTVTVPITYGRAAELLGIDASQVKLLYVYYFANQDSYDPGKMDLNEFLDFLQNTVMTDSTFSSRFDADTADQIDTLSKFASKEEINSQMSAKKMADFMGIDADQVNSIYTYYYGTKEAKGKKLSIEAVVDYILNNDTFKETMDSDAAAKLETFSTLIQAVNSGTELTAKQLAKQTGMEEKQVTQLFQLYAMINQTEVESMTFDAFVDFLVNDILNDDNYASMIPEDAAASLAQAQQMISLIRAGKEYTASGIAEVLGMEESQAEQLYIMYFGSAKEDKTMSPLELVDYMLSDETISGRFDKSTLSKMNLLKTVMNSVNDGKKYTYSSLAELMDMDESTMKLLFVLHEAENDPSFGTLSIRTLVNYINEHGDTFGSMMGDYADNISLISRMINGVVEGAAYGYYDLADLMGMDAADLKMMYLLYSSKYGDISSWQLTPQEFIHFLVEEVFANEDYASQVSEDSRDTLTDMVPLVDAAVNDKALTAKKMYKLIHPLSDELDRKTVRLLYAYYGSVNNYDPEWKMSIEMLFNYLADDLMNDPDFESMFDDDARKDLYDYQDGINEGIDSLLGENYSLMSITTHYDEEANDTFDFIAKLNKLADDNLESDHYYIGSSVMNYEMSESFSGEMLFLSIITALAIFTIILLTFRNLLVPVILVFIVQCAVYITASVSFIQGYAINYLAYLIVQCILMGATVDYGILFTNYYRESRIEKGLDKLQALKESYKGSVHTILTSGLILVIVTGILGFGMHDGAIAPICRTISIGSLAAVILIMFVLPGLLALFDKAACGKFGRKHLTRVRVKR